MMTRALFHRSFIHSNGHISNLQWPRVLEYNECQLEGLLTTYDTDRPRFILKTTIFATSLASTILDTLYKQIA